MTARIAIVTPWNGYHAEWLQQCRESVAAQSLQVEHVLVFDGPVRGPETWRGARVLQVPSAPDHGKNGRLTLGHGDAGNLARGLGAMLCAAEEFDAIAFLDADNWIDVEHVEKLWNFCREVDSPIVAASRKIHALDGAELFDDSESDGDHHVDTNCLFIARPAFDLLPVWTQIPREYAAVGDRVFWKVARSWLRGAAPIFGDATVHYRTPYAVHYKLRGLEPPPNAKVLDDRSGALRFNVLGFRVKL